MDLWDQAVAAAARDDTDEATRLSHLAAGRVERVWRNHAELVKRRSTAQASTVQRKAAARKARQADVLDGTESTIRDTSLMLFARMPRHVLQQGQERLKQLPAAEYTTAGTRYTLVVDGKEAAERMPKVLPMLDPLRNILAGRVSNPMPSINSTRLVDQLARLYPGTARLVAAQEEANALAKELPTSGQGLLAERCSNWHVQPDHHRWVRMCWLRWCWRVFVHKQNTKSISMRPGAYLYATAVKHAQQRDLTLSTTHFCAAATANHCCCCCCCDHHPHTGQINGKAEMEDRLARGLPCVLPKGTTKEQAAADPKRAHTLASQQSEWQGHGTCAGRGGSVTMCYLGLVWVVVTITPQQCCLLSHVSRCFSNMTPGIAVGVNLALPCCVLLINASDTSKLGHDTLLAVLPPLPPTAVAAAAATPMQTRWRWKAGWPVVCPVSCPRA